MKYGLLKIFEFVEFVHFKKKKLLVAC